MLISPIASIICACSGKSDNNLRNRESVIEHTLDSAIRHFTYDALDSSTLNHYDFFPDSLRIVSSIILKNAAQRDTSLSLPIREITMKLSDRILDSVAFVFKESYSFGTNIIIEEEPRKEFFGSINLSDPVFSEDGQLSCYYFALNCYHERNNGCTFSAVVYCIKKRNSWFIKSQKLLFSFE